MKNFVLDSLPLLRFFRKQQDWEQIEGLLEDARKSRQRLLLSAINWGEVYYILLRDEGKSTAQIVEDRMGRAAIEIVLPTIEQIRKAAEMKAGGGISYADCFAGALALERNLPILSDDPEFARLIPFGVKVEWLSRKI